MPSFSSEIPEIRSNEVYTPIRPFEADADPLLEALLSEVQSEETAVQTTGTLWVFVDPAYNIQTEQENIIEIADGQIAIPVIEKGDFLNDGPAALSSAIRSLGYSGSQYLISSVMKPHYFDPDFTFADMEAYLQEYHPDLNSIRRLNGTTQILSQFSTRQIPVILRIESNFPYFFWKADDKKRGLYILLTGYNKEERLFSYIDLFAGNLREIEDAELLSAWYPFQREFLAVYEKDEQIAVAQILGSQYDPKINWLVAEEKFRIDTENLPQSSTAWINYGVTLANNKNYEEAWQAFQTASNIGLTDRSFLYYPQIFETAFALGYADALVKMTQSCLQRSPYHKSCFLWLGWAEILQEDYNEGLSAFKRALSIAPNFNVAKEAIGFVETNQQEVP